MDGIQVLVKELAAQNKYVQEIINTQMSGRTGLKFTPRKYRALQGTQGNTHGTPQLQIKAQPRIASSPHLTLAGARTALGGRICRVTGEELTCTLDEEIHHLNSVKINHHSSTAKGRKKRKKYRSLLETKCSACAAGQL